MTRDFLITVPADKKHPVDFYRQLTGKPPRTEAEKAEREARYARINLIDKIERIEFATAVREREAMIRDKIVNGVAETYEEYHARINAPFERARERVNARIAAFDRKVAA